MESFPIWFQKRSNRWKKWLITDNQYERNQNYLGRLQPVWFCTITTDGCSQEELSERNLELELSQRIKEKVETHSMTLVNLLPMNSSISVLGSNFRRKPCSGIASKSCTIRSQSYFLTLHLPQESFTLATFLGGSRGEHFFSVMIAVSLQTEQT